MALADKVIKWYDNRGCLIAVVAACAVYVLALGVFFAALLMFGDVLGS